jgi:hypothetical protein
MFQVSDYRYLQGIEILSAGIPKIGHVAAASPASRPALAHF